MGFSCRQHTSWLRLRGLSWISSALGDQTPPLRPVPISQCLVANVLLSRACCRAINGILAMSEFKTQFGSDCGSTAIAEPEMSICPKNQSLIVAILSAGTFVGSLLAAPAGDSLGRRITLLISVGIFCIGALCQVCANAIPLLLVGRYVSFCDAR